jgi:hypothetical protein
MWYGRKGIKRIIKKVCGSFFCIRYYYDSRLDVARKIILGKKCVCDIGEKGGEYRNKNVFLSLEWKMVDAFLCFF